MDSKNNRRMEAQLKAQQKYNGRFYKEKKESKYSKRSFFVFFDTIFNHMTGFMGLSLLYCVAIAPILFLADSVNMIAFSAENAELLPIVPYLILFMLLFGGLLLGPTTSACVYIMKCYHEKKYVFFFSDFFKAFKLNFKKSILYGLLDALFVLFIALVVPVIIVVLGNGFSFWWFFVVLFSLIVFVYFGMRMYAYMMIVTIELKLSHINRNALFFSFLGLKKNFLSLILCLLFGGAVYGLFALINEPMTGLAVMLGIFAFIGASLVMYIQFFCSYKTFYKHLIEPILAPEESKTSESGEPSAAYEKDELDD